MSREMISPADLRQLAKQCHSWKDAADKHDQIRTLYRPNTPQFKELDRRLVLNDQALRMLCALNDFDRRKVSEELLDIARYPNQIEADVGRKNWFKRLLKTRYPFNGYHYKISYGIENDRRVVISDVFFDKELLGPKTELPVLERNALYKIDKSGTTKFSPDFTQLGESSERIVGTLQSSWKAGKPTHRVETRYAAVNGMQNELEKAAWLMGSHLDVAHPKADIDQYTLFHNPSDGSKEDLLECLYDKRLHPARTHNTHHFAAVLHEAQKRGHQTHWIAHSQGAIIFSRGVSLALKKYGGGLNCHSVSLHGVGCNLANVRRACLLAGIRIENERNNPFDLVPNVAGMNNLSASGFVRSWKFKGLVFGDDPLASPHTLPYLGLETYIHQLEFTGNHKQAAHARRYRPGSQVQPMAKSFVTLPPVQSRRTAPSWMDRLARPLTAPFKDVLGGPALEHCAHRHVHCGTVDVEFFLPAPSFGGGTQFPDRVDLSDESRLDASLGDLRTAHRVIELGVSNWKYGRPRLELSRFLPVPQEPYVIVTAFWQLERIKNDIQLEVGNTSLLEQYLRDDYHAYLETEGGMNWKIRTGTQAEFEGRGRPQRFIDQDIAVQLLDPPVAYEPLDYNGTTWLRYNWAPRANYPKALNYTCTLTPDYLLTVSLALTQMIPGSLKHWWSPLVEDSEVLMQGTKLHFKELPKKQG